MVVVVGRCCNSRKRTRPSCLDFPKDQGWSTIPSFIHDHRQPDERKIRRSTLQQLLIDRRAGVGERQRHRDTFVDHQTGGKRRKDERMTTNPCRHGETSNSIRTTFHSDSVLQKTSHRPFNRRTTLIYNTILSACQVPKPHTHAPINTLSTCTHGLDPYPQSQKKPTRAPTNASIPA